MRWKVKSKQDIQKVTELAKALNVEDYVATLLV